MPKLKVPSGDALIGIFSGFGFSEPYVNKLITVIAENSNGVNYDSKT
jgi:hypothetical protein